MVVAPVLVLAMMLMPVRPAMAVPPAAMTAIVIGQGAAAGECRDDGADRRKPGSGAIPVRVTFHDTLPFLFLGSGPVHAMPAVDPDIDTGPVNSE